MKSDEEGSITISFGLVIVLLLTAVGLAIDHSQIVRVQTRLNAALDAVSLAAARAMILEGANDARVTELAGVTLKQQTARLDHPGLDLGLLDVKIDRDSGTVTASLNAKLGSTFAKLVGYDNFSLSARSKATHAIKDIELGMMLDVSGSMNDNGKLGTLKTAAKELFDVMLPDVNNPSTVRIGLAPYSTSVNAGVFATDVKGNSGKAGNTCVSERKKNDDGFNDKSPKKGKKLGHKAENCPAATILPLTKDKDTLRTTIDSYVASGRTAGHLGAAWAWYLVSPEWRDVWPSDSAPFDYGQKNLIKAVVLMTDGMFNEAYEIDENGDSVAQSLALCENMKQQGVLVFTVGFQAPAEVLPTLQACASGASRHFDVQSSGQLVEVFRGIGQELTQLRIAE